jgi:hypothetical protein
MENINLLIKLYVYTQVIKDRSETISLRYFYNINKL